MDIFLYVVAALCFLLGAFGMYESTRLMFREDRLVGWSYVIVVFTIIWVILKGGL